MVRLREESHRNAHARRHDDEHRREVDDDEEQREVGASEGALVAAQEDVDRVEAVLADPALDAAERAAHLDRETAVSDVRQTDENWEEPCERNHFARATSALTDDSV